MDRSHLCKHAVNLGLALVFLTGCGVPPATVAPTQPPPPPTAAPTLVPTAPPVPTPTATAVPAPVWVASFKGDPKPFLYPNSVAVDAQGNLYVIDAEASLVQKLDPAGKGITQWGGHEEAFSFGFPAVDPSGRSLGGNFKASCLAIDAAGNVYVSDSGNHRIQKFDGDGKFLTGWGSAGEGDGQFSNAICVGVDGKGYVYVADTYNHRVQKFDANGKFIRTWGSKGVKAGQFQEPWKPVGDAEGNVYVVDMFNSRFQKFDPDGNFLAKFDIPPVAGRLVMPLSLAQDGQGGFYVLEGDRVLKLDSRGVVVTMWGSEGSDEGQFLSTGMIAVDAQGYIYVADSSNGRIQKFRQP